jgi:hypothetical protein
VTIKLTADEAKRLGLKPSRAKRSPIDHRDYKSNLERRYAEELESRKIAGDIIDWRYEPIKLHLGGGAWFTPDFLVVVNGPVAGLHWESTPGDMDAELHVTMWCGMEFHEVKGHWEEAAKVRLKVAVEKYPWFSFFVVTAGGKKGGAFEIERWSK